MSAYEQRIWAKECTKRWQTKKYTILRCLWFSGANDGPLLSFVIGDQTDPNNINNNNHHNPAPVPNQNNDNNNNANGGGLQAAHLALLQVNIPDEPQDYKRPSLFPLRIVGLILITMMTVYILSCVTLFFPTFIGRKLMSLWFGDLRVHELYTCAIGVYSCWALMRTVICIASWVSAGLTLFKEKIRKFCTTVTKVRSSIMLRLTSRYPIWPNTVFGFLEFDSKWNSKLMALERSLKQLL